MEGIWSLSMQASTRNQIKKNYSFGVAEETRESYTQA